MNYIQTEIDGVWLIEPKVFHDARGYFMEAFKEEEFRAHVGDVHFIQDNEVQILFRCITWSSLPEGRFAARLNWYVSLKEKCWTWLST